ncbi:MAG: hypothetical protein KDC54_19505 [Lewinella sp.]|nr:hypothetical protein [Lewinella sp.]
MKKSYLLFSLAVLLSVSAYLFLHIEKKAVLDAKATERELVPEAQAPTSVQPDIFLIKTLMKSAVQLLPAS